MLYLDRVCRVSHIYINIYACIYPYLPGWTQHMLLDVGIRHKWYLVFVIQTHCRLQPKISPNIARLVPVTHSPLTLQSPCTCWISRPKSTSVDSIKSKVTICDHLWPFGGWSQNIVLFYCLILNTSQDCQIDWAFYNGWVWDSIEPHLVKAMT